MTTRHSDPVRGLPATLKSPLFDGRFGRLFRGLPAAHFGSTDAENKTNLANLGAKMCAGFDPPKDGFDDEESAIPAVYTYFGQFIDHDLTFDPMSDLQKRNDPDALTDFRSPAFDLDCVYGRGKDDQPYLYTNDGSFLFGDAISGGSLVDAKDLRRNGEKPSRAIIGDPRNDENSIVSQLQGLMLRFHNRALKENGSDFREAQMTLRHHYQYIVLNDFLPRIAHSSVILALKTNDKYDPRKIEWFKPRTGPFMPVEFSVAAYRLGHSMVRPGYRLNDSDSTLLPIFPVPSQGLNDGLTGFGAMAPNRGIDWGRFIDVDTRKYDGTDADKKKRLQFAYRIDTSLVNPLMHLPEIIAKDPDNLAARNLLRGWSLRLPSGQSVAHRMGVRVLKDEEILIGKALDQPAKADEPVPITSISPAFKGNCPLWTYILAEAMHYKETVKIPVTEDKSISTPRLGPVGGRIVAEVFLGLMAADHFSYLAMKPNWTPSSGTRYSLRDFVRYAAG